MYMYMYMYLQGEVVPSSLTVTPGCMQDAACVRTQPSSGRCRAYKERGILLNPMRARA